MKQQINEIHRMQQLAGLIKENEAPKAITVKLTDKFIKGNELSKVNDNIQLFPNVYYNVGNTKVIQGKPVNIYFIMYRPDIQEIGFSYFEAPSNESFLKVANEQTVNDNKIKNIIDNVGGKWIPGGDSKFLNGFNVGETDDDGYYKITATK